jgi:CRP/FNR family transcriptional regulator, cyclic AMP receptor protein
VFRRSRNDLKVAWLEQHSRLYGLTRAEVDALATAADRITVPAGTVLVRAGQLGREAFLVVRGEVEIRRDGDRVASVGPGELVGEQALVDRAHRNADAIATTETELAVFGPRSFEQALAASPALRAHVEQTVAARAVA